MAEVASYLSESRHRRSHRRRIGIFLLAVAGLYALLIIASWFILRSPLFRVDSIVVRGNKEIPADLVKSTLLAAVLKGGWSNVLGWRNMLAWPSSLSAYDLRFLPEAESITIEKNYRAHEIFATVAERTPAGIWCSKPAAGEPADSGGAQASFSCFWFDAHGILYKRTVDAQGNLIPVVHDYTGEAAGLRAQVLTEPLVANLISVFRALEAGGVSVKEIKMNQANLEEVEADTNDGPVIYFSLRQSADEDAQVLAQLKARPQFKYLQYIDFRVENRAYYK